MEVQVVSPEKILWSGEADTVVARTVGGGDIAFLDGHAPFVGALEIAQVIVHGSGGDKTPIAVHGGFVEVSNSKVTILSDVAELGSDVDVARARAARDRAQSERGQAEDDAEVVAAMRRAEVRLRAAGVEE